MRRATWVGLITLLLAAGLGLQRASDNMADEADAAMSLAEVVALLGSLGELGDRSAVEQLSALQVRAPLRHLELRVHDAAARLLLGPPPPRPVPSWLDAVYRLHRTLAPQADHRVARWHLARPDGRSWTISLSTSHESERREALTDLLGMLALLGAGITALLLVMQANVRHALLPLNTLLEAIRGIEAPDHRAADAMRALPPAMPIRELEVIAGALRHLAQALDEASAQRRALSRKLVSLQEDERAHLARELHDEFGQRLTALRLDAAWLQHQLGQAMQAADPPGPATLLPVVDEMAARCAEVQADIRQLLVRLRPLGPGTGAAFVSWAELVAQLESLVDSWRSSSTRNAGLAGLHDRAPDYRFTPRGPRDGAALMLRSDIALTVYRLSQEALTNIARHAGARHVHITLAWPGEPVGRGARLRWQVSDDGVGIANPAQALRRGNGLGGMQERVWALGGEWQWGPAMPHTDPLQRGLTLSAGLPIEAADAPSCDPGEAVASLCDGARGADNPPSSLPSATPSLSAT
jgi:two-component system sensor histidine kinase UhpB